MTHFIIAYHVSLVNVQTNYCNDNLLILDVKQLNKIMELYYFHTSKAIWDGQGKIKIDYGMSRVKKQLLGERSITTTQNGIRATVTSFLLRQCYVIYFVQKTGQLILEKLP